MKKRIISAFLAVLMVISILTPLTVFAEDEKVRAPFNDAYVSEEDRLSRYMQLVATSDDTSKPGTGDGMLELYVDYDTGEFAIKNKVTGEIFLSNPYSVTTTASNEGDKGKFMSQIILKYFKLSQGESGMTELYSYKDGFYFGQGNITPTSNGMKIDYSIGEDERDFAVPKKIALEDFYGALRAVGISDADIQSKIIGDNFEVFDPDQKYYKDSLLDKDVTGGYRQSLIDKEPLCVTTPFMRLQTKVYQSNQTMRILEASLKEKAPNYFVLSAEGEEKTQFEIDRDALWNEANDAQYFPEKEYINFKFTAIYTLTDDGLTIEIDTNSVEYNRELYCLANITVLPYFSAADMMQTRFDNGYIFIPDGSGAIIRYEDLVAKGQQGTIKSTLYGADYSKYQITGKNIEQFTMPVFGLVNSSEGNGSGYFAIIEEGDALAAISSEAGPFYASAYATFNYNEYDIYDLADAFSGGASSSTEITVVSKDAYKGKYKMSYKLLTADATAEEYGLENTYDTSYVGMAKLYRDYLINNGTIKKFTETEENIKLFLEVFGSIKVKEQIFSFPVTVNKELTSFSDVMNIQKDLALVGINNNSFILKGFYNGGLSSSYPTKIKWQKVLGGEKGLNDLLLDAEKNGYDVALDVDFSYAHSSKWFSGYSNKKNAIKTLDNRYTTKRAYYAATQTFERTSGVAVSTASFISLFDKFADSISDINIKTLAIRALGSDLNSDFNKEGFISREDAKNNVIAFMKLMTRENDKKFNLIVDTGNSYAIPYASGVLSAPIDSSKYRRASESVPFFGMVYHGSIEFAGNALNMEGDESYMLLKAMENGAALYYTIAMENVEKLKANPEYSNYYSINYEFLKDSIIENYTIYNNAMKDKQDKFIVDHRFLNNSDSDVTVTLLDGTAVDNSLVVLVVYEGGEGFILNYNSQDVIVRFEGVEYKVRALNFKAYSQSTKEANAK